MSETTTLLEAQAEIHKKMAEMREQLKTIGEKLFKEGAQDFFDAFPEAGSFSWTQYTPYFNDGDECVFSVHDYFDVTNTNGDLLWEDLDAWGAEYSRKQGKELTREQEASEVLSTLVGGIDDDTMKALFGDHVRVTVTREGIDIEEYDHD